MEMKKVVVTGANGYIGAHVVQALLRRGHQVIAVDIAKNHLPEEVELSQAQIFSGDKDIYDQLGRPDAVIHLAWQDGFVHNSSAHMDHLSAHVRFLRQLVDAGVPKLSVMGTMHEIGYWEGMIDERTPCNPLSQYGIAKNALRQSIMLYAEGKTTSLRWLRAFYIYGDDLRAASIFGKMQKAAAEGKKHFPFTSGKNQYDFIDVKELADQIAVAALQDITDGIINTCTGSPKSLGEQVEEYIQKNRLDLVLDYGAFPDRKYDSPAVWGDGTKIKEIMQSCSQGK